MANNKVFKRELAWRDRQIKQLKADLEERSKTDKAEPVAWDYEWASYITCEGPQDFKRVIEREAPPKWAIEEGQARNIIPLYIAPPTPLVPDDIPDSVYEILYQACGGKAWMYGEALWKACRAAMFRDLSQPVDPQISEYENDTPLGIDTNGG